MVGLVGHFNADTGCHGPAVSQRVWSQNLRGKERKERGKKEGETVCNNNEQMNVNTIRKREGRI